MSAICNKLGDLIHGLRTAVAATLVAARKPAAMLDCGHMQSNACALGSERSAQANKALQQTVGA
jgi:hypothetical protein